MLTDQEKLDALMALSKLPSVETEVMENGEKYLQVMPSSNGVHIVERHEYVGPEGAGYTDIVRVEKEGVEWIYREHYGREKYRDAESGVWIELKPEMR